MSSLQVAGAEIERDVVAKIAGHGLCAVQRLNGLCVVVIEEVGVSDDEPCERPGVFFGMRAGVGFDSGIGGGSTVGD